jgi:hypothetical protein
MTETDTIYSSFGIEALYSVEIIDRCNNYCSCIAESLVASCILRSHRAYSGLTTV